jgi:hypothetical protein
MSRLIPLFFLVALCAGCGGLSTQTEGDALQVALNAYENALRWGGFDQAVKYIDPETLKQHPLTELDVERYKQFRVISYTEQPPVPVAKHEISQVVEVGVVNVNTQIERTVIDRQVWRYDEKTKHWHIVSGLPDMTQR